MAEDWLDALIQSAFSRQQSQSQPAKILSNHQQKTHLHNNLSAEQALSLCEMVKEVLVKEDNVLHLSSPITVRTLTLKKNLKFFLLCAFHPNYLCFCVGLVVWRYPWTVL